MKVLVCGGRDYDKGSKVFIELDAVFLARDRANDEKIIVINGGATGADKFAREWSRIHFQPRITVPANWTLHGKRAGPIRNSEMLRDYRPDLVLAFPGGKGTADMVKKARAAGVEVKEIK